MIIRKRPLCLAALLLALVLLCLPTDLWMMDPPTVQECPAILTGTISRMEPGGKTVWLPLWLAGLMLLTAYRQYHTNREPF